MMRNVIRRLWPLVCLISGQAFAAAPDELGAPISAGWAQFLIFAVFFGGFYFIFLRPQNNRIKEQKELLNGLTLGDEVVTSGGLCGKIARLNEDFINMEIAPNVIVVVQKQAILNTLPRDTLQKFR